MASTAAVLAPAASACRPPRCLPASASSRRALKCATQRPQHRRWQHLARAEAEGSEQQAAPAAAATQQEPRPAAPQQQQQRQQEEEPIWVRRERERAAQKAAGGSGELPFGAYLLFSAFTAIAAVGSIFEYVNQHAVFDVIQPDSPLYTLILGFFALTGLPTAGFLFYKAVQAANREAERMDKMDGY